MRTFDHITGKAVPILRDDIDTDVILPARFLLLLSHDGLASKLFADARKGDRALAAAFEEARFQAAPIVVGGARFGIGSSREQAVWAFRDFGTRCIIARSFGEIFRANCVINGILPVTLNDDDSQTVGSAACAGEDITVDLRDLSIVLTQNRRLSFVIDDASRSILLSGRDPLTRILSEETAAIAAFEQRQSECAPWLEVPCGRFAFLNERG